MGSAIYDVAHGAGLSVVFPAWLKYNYKQDIQRFVQFAVRVWDVDYSFGDPNRIALEGIERQKRFFKSLELPVSLTDMQIPGDRLGEMAAKAVLFGPIGQFKKLNQEDVHNILQLAL